MGREALMVAGELHRGAAQALSQRQRGQVGHLPLGRRPHPHHDAGRHPPQPGNVGDVVDSGRQQVRQEEPRVGLHPRHPLPHLRGQLRHVRHLPSLLLAGRSGVVLLGICAAGAYHGLDEPLHPGPDPLTPVGLVHLLERSPPPRAVSQQVHRRRLVGDQRVHPLGVAGDHVQPDQRSAAAAQHLRRSIGEGGQQLVGVVALDLHRQPTVGELVGWSVQGAAGGAAPVIGHHRVAVGELVGQSGEPAGVGRRARDQQQQRAGPPGLVVQARARHLQGGGPGRAHRFTP
jgi:hypothetical protein